MEPSGGRVLLVERDPDLRETLTWILSDAGFAVDAEPGAEAAIVRLAGRRYVFVLADHERPDEEGAARLLRLRQAAEPVLVGVLTAWRTSDERLPPSGFAFVREKPLPLEDLLSLVSAHAAVPLDQAGADVARRYFAALSGQRWSELEALCREDVRYHLPGADPAFARTVEGRDAFVRFSAETFAAFPETTFEVRELVGLPRGVVAIYRGSWRGPSGERLGHDGAVLLRLEGGRIAEIGVRLELPKLRELIA